MDSTRLHRVLKALNNDLYKQFPLSDCRANWFGSPISILTGEPNTHYYALEQAIQFEFRNTEFPMN